jgi:hypothetical protein
VRNSCACQPGLPWPWVGSAVTVVAVVVERIDVMGGKGTATAPGDSGGSGGRAWRMGGRRDGGWQR